MSLLTATFRYPKYHPCYHGFQVSWGCTWRISSAWSIMSWIWDRNRGIGISTILSSENRHESWHSLPKIQFTDIFLPARPDPKKLLITSVDSVLPLLRWIRVHSKATSSAVATRHGIPAANPREGPQSWHREKSRVSFHEKQGKVWSIKNKTKQKPQRLYIQNQKGNEVLWKMFTVYMRNDPFS